MFRVMNTLYWTRAPSSVMSWSRLRLSQNLVGGLDLVKSYTTSQVLSPLSLCARSVILPDCDIVFYSWAAWSILVNASRLVSFTV